MNTSIKNLLGWVCFMGLSGQVAAHGLISEPPSRNAHCGMNERADNASTPACVEAAEFDAMGMYSYMSVLTHDVGRQGVMSENVCGFDSETWDGERTPWDLPLDWPVTEVESGPLTITWDVSMGPHFDDTEEFVYYITRPGFEYQVGQPLSWSDFETEPFCLLKYDDSSPSANPDIVADQAAALFHTQCQIPERSGRHVIYGEWGRNYFTYERFHGCIDVSFGGKAPDHESQPGDDSSEAEDPDQNNSSGSEEEPVVGAGALTPFHMLFAMLGLFLLRRRVAIRPIDGTGSAR